MDSALETKVKEWLSLDRNEATRAEIKQLVACQNYSALRSALLTRMEFGTAGLRAAMGAGFARMNDLTVIQTSFSVGRMTDEYLRVYQKILRQHQSRTAGRSAGALSSTP